MTTAESRDAGTSEVRIEGEMTIYQAEQMKTTLLAALENASALEVNLAGVTEIDTAGVQLLMLAKETARAHDKELRLSSHSDAVVEVLELVDLVSYFGDPVVISSSAADTAGRAANIISGEHADGT